MSNSKKLQWVCSGEFCAAVSQPPQTQADIVIPLPLSQPCWAPWLLLSLHFHSKYTDHCTRLRKHRLCILAGGIYFESATDLLYLVFDGWGSRGNTDSMTEVMHTVTAAIAKTNNKVAQIKFRFSEADRRMWSICHDVTEEHPELLLHRTARGPSSRRTYRRAWKQQLALPHENGS